MPTYQHPLPTPLRIWSVIRRDGEVIQITPSQAGIRHCRSDALHILFIHGKLQRMERRQRQIAAKVRDQVHRLHAIRHEDRTFPAARIVILGGLAFTRNGFIVWATVRS